MHRNLESYRTIHLVVMNQEQICRRPAVKATLEVDGGAEIVLLKASPRSAEPLQKAVEWKTERKKIDELRIEVDAKQLGDRQDDGYKDSCSDEP